LKLVLWDVWDVQQERYSLLSWRERIETIWEGGRCVFGIIEIQRTAAKMSQEKLKIKKA